MEGVKGDEVGGKARVMGVCRGEGRGGVEVGESMSVEGYDECRYGDG